MNCDRMHNFMTLEIHLLAEKKPGWWSALYAEKHGYMPKECDYIQEERSYISEEHGIGYMLEERGNMWRSALIWHNDFTFCL